MIGKILGGFFGFLMGGPLGLVLGIFIGHFFDRGLAQHFSQFKIFRAQNHEAQQVFFKTTFEVMGYIAKADGVVSEAEIEKAREIMRRLNLNEAQKKAAIEAFNRGKQTDFDLPTAIQGLKTKCHRNRFLLQLFLEFQISAATINDHLTPIKEKIITQISENLGFMTQNPRFNFEDFFSAFNNYSQFQQNRSSQDYSRGTRFKNEMALDKAYQVLGISPSVSNDEIKKSYRKLISQNHPDKLVAKGLPPEMIKLATEKTQQIQLSYERICTARGIG